MRKVPQAGAIALRERKGRVEAMIVRARKDPSQWIFPKGHIERGETAEDAAVRELQEEAGVDGSADGVIGVSTFQSGTECVDVTFYLVRYSRMVKPSEKREARWCSIDEARRTLSFDDSRRLLDEAIRRFIEHD
jgi:8-oxo-dGTP pyrophosphatase MutT (NUDIX family)